MAVIVLRHSPPDVPEGTCYGQTDVPLRHDFPDHVAQVLALLPPIAAIRTSPLSRCTRLADALAGALEMSAVPDPDLAEMNFGAWEDRPWDDIPRGELDAWAADFHRARPHGGECVDDLAARATRALNAARSTPAPVLLVTHAGIIRALWAAAQVPGAWSAQVPYATPLTLQAEPA